VNDLRSSAKTTARTLRRPWTTILVSMTEVAFKGSDFAETDIQPAVAAR
jgi:hypothetical protein